MEEILSQLAQYGPIGVVAAYGLWQMNKTQSKLIDIIEKNTQAFQELKDIIDKCQTIHKD